MMEDEDDDCDLDDDDDDGDENEHDDADDDGADGFDGECDDRRDDDDDDDTWTFQDGNRSLRRTLHMYMYPHTQGTRTVYENRKSQSQDLGNMEICGRCLLRDPSNRVCQRCPCVPMRTIVASI